MSTTDGTVIGATKIVDHGSPEKKFNLVLVAEGYQQTDLAQFAADAQQFVDYLFAAPPFNELRCAFNIYRVDVSSTDSGADDPAACGGTGATPATYFDASFCNGGIQRLLVADTLSVQNIVNAEVPQWHQVLVIVNSYVYGGSGGTIAVTSTAAGWENLALHEMGHSIFGLADEYEYYAGCGIDTNRDQFTGTEPAEPNVTIDNSRATIKWQDLVQAATPMPTTSNADCSDCDPQPNPVPDSTVGAFEGGKYYHCGIYRPQFNCMMRNLAPFCAVCSSQIQKTLSQFIAKCYAPVFHEASRCTCFFRTIGYILIIAVLVIFIWIPAVRCLIKKILFRIRHCRAGNANGCIEL